MSLRHRRPPAPVTEFLGCCQLLMEFQCPVCRLSVCQKNREAQVFQMSKWGTGYNLIPGEGLCCLLVIQPRLGLGLQWVSFAWGALHLEMTSPTWGYCSRPRAVCPACSSLRPATPQLLASLLGSLHPVSISSPFLQAAVPLVLESQMCTWAREL